MEKVSPARAANPKVLTCSTPCSPCPTEFIASHFRGGRLKPSLRKLIVGSWNVEGFFFFSLTPFCRDRSQVKELFYWSASRHWDCFYTGQSPDVQSPRQSPLTNQGGCGGSRLGCVGSGGSCARRSLRDGGSPSRL